MSRANKFKIFGLPWISVLIILVSYLPAYGVEHLMGAAIEKQAVADTVFNLSEVYQTIIARGRRKLEQNYTVLVDFNPRLAIEPGNPCGEKGTRRLLAELLDKINEQKPAVIVIDKYFPKSCGESPDEDKSGTGKLRSALLNISRGIPDASEATPIVIGKRVLTKEQQLMPSQPSLQFDSPPNSENIKEAIVNIAPDNRRLALKWSFGTEDDKKIPEVTLAYAAATAYYESKSKYMSEVTSHTETRISALKDLATSPYISFINPLDLMVIDAEKLIRCGGEKQPKCKEHLFRLLRGKVVIIGESKNIDDQHDSLFGHNLAGYTIQANYIEALLDQRYYESIRALDLVVGFLVFVLIYYSVHKTEKVWNAQRSRLSDGDDLSIYQKTLRNIAGFTNLSWESSIRLDKVLNILAFIALSSLAIFLLLIAVVVVFGIYINPDTLSFQAIIIILTHLILPKTQAH